jgi:SAM-dependent methyltransferase
VSSAFQGAIESPAPGQNVYDAAIFVSGWVHLGDRSPPSCEVRAYVDEQCCAASRVFFPRSDVAPGSVGFRLLGQLPAIAEQREALLRVVVSGDDNLPITIAEQRVQLLPASLRRRPYGEVVFPENETLLHRENIYGSGPPLEQPGVEVAGLIANYLPERASVVDVGCGAGAYGPGLLRAGHEWLGLETNAHCCEILARRGLPFRRVESAAGKLPGDDAEFDCAICIEVLEHASDTNAFLSEIARLIRKRALFSVPNLELLPYHHDWGVVPWHLLEGDHKNFFTRASLKALLSRFFKSVEVFSYGEHPLRTRDGVPLHVHLFAIADK